MIFLGYVVFDETKVVDNFDQLLLKLSIEDQSEIHKYKFWRDKQATLFGKLLLSKILREQFGLQSIPSISIEEHGRPSLNSNLDFNISHSGNYVLCCVSDEASIGIDVEKHRKVNIDTFDKYFTSKEWKEIYKYEDTLNGFFDFWSMKESVIKADGRGVSILSKTERQNARTVFSDGRTFFIQKLNFSPIYSSYIASSSPIHDLAIKEIKPNNL